MAGGHARRYRALRELHRRHLLRAHERGSGRREPVLPGARGARLTHRDLRCRTLRPAGPGPGARELRTRGPQLHHARLRR